jgi:chromosomal replication initiator protein
VTTSPAANIWAKAARHLQEALRPEVFERWISIIEPAEIKDQTLFLNVDNDFYRTWLQEHYLPLIQKAVIAAGDDIVDVSFAIKTPAATRPEKKEPPRKRTLRERLSGHARKLPPLNEKFKFDAFVVGPCNNFAHAASLAVAQAPARAYNPLFIYGGVGLGKTHLMQAIGHYLAYSSRSNVCYLSSEALMNEYIEHLQHRTLVQFRKKYRGADLLLIDDIHFLAGKTALQEEFFHTFNTLFDAHRQIVMTSDRPASEIVGLEKRLVSRFEWGLVTELESPDFETRLAILRHKATLLDEKDMPEDEFLVFIAENIKSNVRRLEGALIRVVSYRSLTGHAITVDAVKHLLRDTINEEIEAAVTLPAIQKAVAEHYDVRLADLVSTRRPRAIAGPRHVAMYLCRKLTDSSFPEIGQSFGKSHATVFHACRTMETKLTKDANLQNSVTLITRDLQRSV